MGPYCTFCNQRCFTSFPEEAPDFILNAYGTCSLMATCKEGQEFEKKKLGWCYDDVQNVIKAINRAIEGDKSELLHFDEVEEAMSDPIAKLIYQECLRGIDKIWNLFYKRDYEDGFKVTIKKWGNRND